MKETLISIVDDDESVRNSTESLLRSVGYKVACFPSSSLFLESDAIANTACLILDIRMPGMDGLELQRHMNMSDARVPIIFVTAFEDKKQRQQAMAAGASDFFQKPYPASDFLAAVHKTLHQPRVAG